MADRDQPEVAHPAAAAARPPDFDDLVRRARRVRRTTVAGAALAVAAVFGGAAVATQGFDDSAPAPTPPARTGPALPDSPATATPTATTTTTTPTIPTTTASALPSDGACPPTSLPELPRGAGCATLVRGVVDGDANADRIIVYAAPLDASGQALGWHLRIELAAGTVVTRSIAVADRSTNLAVVGAADADGDGRDEVLVLLHRGAATDCVGLFRLAGDRHIARVQTSDGHPFAWSLGATVDAGSGGACTSLSRRPALGTSSYWHGGGKWHWRTTSYRWKDGALVKAAVDHGLTTEGGVASYTRLTCGRVAFDQLVPAPPVL